MKGNFAASLEAVLAHEGGWSDHPSDPGGATMKGVTLATYRRYRPGATKQDLRNISDADLQRIYRDGYWNAIRGDELPAGLDYALFDFAVNSGPSRAVTYLQTIVGAAPDGKMGPLTLAAIAKHSPVTLIGDLCSHRLAFLERLSTWPTYGKGWVRRVAEVRLLATRMAQDEHKAKPPIASAPPPDRTPISPGAIITLAILAAALVAVFLLN